MKLSNIFESLLNEIAYPLKSEGGSWNNTAEGYDDASNHIGERVWVHTNFSNKNYKHNGTVGVFTPNSKGLKGSKNTKAKWYTNEVRIEGPLVFEQPESGAKRIKNSQLKQLVAGVSGKVIPSGPLSSEGKGDTSGMDMVIYNAKEGLGYFHLAVDDVQPPRKIVGGSEVYVWCSEEGKYGFYVRGPIFENDINDTNEI
jgi:hypothetical protein